MIYATVKPPDQYVELIKNTTIGLYTTYGHDPHMFNLVSRVSTAMFLYEPEFDDCVKLGTRMNRLYGEDYIRETISQNLDSIPMKTILESTTPPEMHQMFIEHQPDFPISNLYGSLATLLQAMNLRALQFRKYYRGRISSGNTIRVQFKSDLSPREELQLTSALASLKKNI